VSDNNEERRASQDDDQTGSLWHRIYRGKATNVALGLFIAGIAFLAMGTIVHEDQSLGHEIAHHVLRDVGIAAIISAVLGSAYEYLLRGDFVEDVEKRLRRAVTEERPTFVEDAEKSFRTAVTEERGKLKAEFVADAKTTLANVLNDRDRFNSAGVTGICDGRSAAMIEGMFKNGPQEVRILETWTGHRGSGSKGIAAWIHEAVEAGCETVRILLLDPKSRQVEDRAEALGESREDIRHNILSDLERLEKVQLQHKDRIVIKVYDAVPSVNMFCFDDTRIVGMYFWGVDSADSPQFTVRTSSGFLARQLDNHFENLWSAGKTRVWSPDDAREGP
jgi:hypothetical protein